MKKSNPPRKSAPRKYARPLFPAEPKPTTPSQTQILPDVAQGFTAIVQIARDVLINPDIAYRTDRRLSEQMLRDPIVEGPLATRCLATAQQEWQIVPDDDQDMEQVERADNIDRLIRKMSRPQDFFRELLLGVWRGTGTAEVYWMQEEGTDFWYPAKYLPHHGDKITYDINGNPRILTRQFQTGGRELSPEELDRLIIHVYHPDDGSFYEGAEAAYVFKGRGLRDSCWPYWWLMHNATAFWLKFIQRYGGGMALGKYPQGNAQAQAAIKSVLKSMQSDSLVTVPVPTDIVDRETYGIEILNAGDKSSSSQVFKEFVEDWAGKHIRILIQGQDQAYQESGDGLGSGRAKALSDIFRMYRDYDATALGDTLTHTLVERLQRFNYGQLPYQCRFEFVLDKENYDQQAARVKAAQEAGLPVPKKWAYEALGIPMPQDTDEPIILGQAQQTAEIPGMPGQQSGFPDGGGPLFNGTDEPSFSPFFGPAPQRDNQSMKMFRAALRDTIRR